ncbi:Nitrogen regulation protein NR(I) [hydrothermal vent metagenome]|uniref:Nitrogen regulation protein NR(I) n=1 Tax=hydrothermal vent metagenome TaxID=652676 RepID=A0A3B1CVV5_9ZZZZ
MPNIQKYLKNKNFIRIGILILSLLILVIFKSSTGSINSSVESFFYSVHGASKPDSNIVLIKITQNDIEKLGGWPLKRSYYALLFDKLLQQDPAKIGLEVFLANNSSNQSIYNDLIINELKRSDKIVLSCLLSTLTNNNNILYTDSVLYPLANSGYKNIQLGHINYLELQSIYIPQKLIWGSDTLYSFSQMLSSNANSKQLLLKINFRSSIKDFRSYSLIQFFDLLENKKLPVELKDKIVIIGVTDPTIGKSVSTSFDKTLPGLGLHAIAVDNLLTGSFLIDKYVSPSTFFFIILILLNISIVRRYQLIYYPVIFIIFLLISFVLFTSYYIELNYTSFIIPIFFLFVTEIVFRVQEKEYELSEAYSEMEILERALLSKEKALSELEAEAAKSSEPPKHLIQQVETLKEQVQLLRKSQKENETVFQFDDSAEVNNFLGMVYCSSAMQKMVDMINRVAPTDASILIIGESGSGKELIANAIHKMSKRKDENYVAFNCAAIPESLLESELFGHVKGAFTDASTDKIGRFEAADKGTIFLDEIGETSENFQTKLLRVLQTGELQKVGSSETKHVDIRVIAATNKNLLELVKEKQFREDLYYRLNVITLEVPPLRERPEDIPVIAEYFAQRENPELKISKAVMKILLQNEWTGNVRELESTIKRAAIFAQTDNRNIIKIVDLPSELAHLDKSNLEQMILDSLREKEFSHSAINETAKELGNISRTIISENFRGIFFQNYVQTNFDLEQSCRNIVDFDNEEVMERVRKKGKTYLKNLEADIENAGDISFDELKSKFSSKYKNLPQKYHVYLDEVIKKLLD